MINGGRIGVAAAPSSTKTDGIWTFGERGALGFDDRKHYTWPGAANDPSFASVIGLWHFQPIDLIPFNVSNGNSGIKDYSNSSNNLIANTSTGTALGPLIDSENPLWGTHSGHIAGSGCGGFYNTSTTFQFGTGDFTIEVWGNLLSRAFPVNILDFRSSSGSQAAPVIYNVAADQTLRYFVSGADRIVSGSGVWATGLFFLALSRVSGSTRMYCACGITPGSSVAQIGSTYTDASNYNVGYFQIGGPNIATTANNMLIHEVRITKGVGRYSGASLTAPTGPFPDY